MLGPLRQKFTTVAGVAPRVYWYVWWGTLINRLGGFVVPLLTIYMTTVRGESVSTAGAVVSCFGAGQIFASLIGGQLTDRVGRRATMLMSLFGGTVAMVGLGQARSITEISVMVGVVGFVGDLYRPAVAAFIADVVPPEQRLEAYGLLYWAVNVGFAFASAIGGLIARFDFEILFYVDAATMAIYGVIVALFVPETRPGSGMPTISGNVLPSASKAAARSMWRDRVFLAFVGICLLLVLLPLQAGAVLAAHMTWQGFSPAAYGIVMAVNGILIIAFQPLITGWSARFDGLHVMACAALLYGAGMYIHGLAPIAVAHAGAVAVWTFGEILESPTRSAMVAHMAPPEARGRYQGMLAMTWGVGQLVGPRGGTWLWEHRGPSALWTACLGLSGLVALGFLAIGPAVRARMASLDRA
jgi:MFS family permease